MYKMHAMFTRDPTSMPTMKRNPDFNPKPDFNPGIRIDPDFPDANTSIHLFSRSKGSQKIQINFERVL